MTLTELTSLLVTMGCPPDKSREMAGQLQKRAGQLAEQKGKTEEEVVAAKVTAPYDAKVPGGLLPAGAGTSADRFVRMVYSQLKSGK